MIAICYVHVVFIALPTKVLIKFVSQYEAVEKKNLEVKLNNLKLHEKQRSGDIDLSVFSEERLEVWIRPDGSSSKHTNKLEEQPIEEELNVLTDVNVSYVASLCIFIISPERSNTKQYEAI